MRKFFAFALACLIAAPSYAATVSISGGGAGRDPSPAELGNDASLAGKKIYEFFVTSDADILSVDNVVIQTGGAALYQNLTNGDVEPPNPAFVAVFPALGADSWITTPGATSTAGGGFANDNSSWFDSSNDGAVTNFLFARLTHSGTQGTFNGRVNVLGAGSTVENFPFSLTMGNVIPEPTTVALGLMGLVGLVAARRRSA